MNDGLLQKPSGASHLYVLGHGAGAGMRHPFMQTTADLLAEREVATYRYEFPYMAEGRRRPDAPKVLEERVQEVVEAAAKSNPKLALIAGGKSMGGRITSQAAAKGMIPAVQGLVFLGFPLHAPGRPGTKRAEHLADVDVPMLFLQGTRDSLADIDLMKDVCKGIGRRATLYIIEDGDHSFKVLKRSGREQSEVMAEIADTIAAWAARLGR